MKVLHVNKYYHPETGGIEQVVETLAEGTAERGHEVRVLASVSNGPGYNEVRNDVSVYKKRSFGVVYSVPISPFYLSTYFKHAKWADVIHHHVPNPLGTVSELVASTKAVTVATYHSDIIRQKRAMIVYKPLLKRFLKNIDQIFVTSPPLLESSKYLSPFQNKCTIAPLSINPSENIGCGKKRIELPCDEDKPIVLFVGRLNYYKGVKYLIEAASEIDAVFLIVGDGAQRKQLERLTQKKNISNHVHFLGFIDDDSLKKYYSAADIFVLPSVEPSEAFGIVQLEAMINKTPVINTALRTGVPWVSKDGVTGLTVQPRDSEALANAIITLLENDQMRRIYGKNAKNRVLEQFTDERLIDTVLQTYERLITE